jgi:replicative DNA helicase
MKKLSKIVEERGLELKEWMDEPDKHRPVSTGISDFDRLIGGFPRYPFYFALIGATKAGKTTVGFNLTLALCANSGIRTAVYMLEEGEREVADRAIAKASTKIGRTEIFKLQLTKEMLGEISEIPNIYDIDYYVEDAKSNIHEILKHANENGFTQIVIDNFQLLTGGKGQNKREQFEDISQTIMRARQQGTTVFLVSQGNDDGDSFGSKQVLKDANIVILIETCKVDPSDKNSPTLETMRKLTVRQSRFCPQGEYIVLFFDGNHSRVIDIPVKNPDMNDFYHIEEKQESHIDLNFEAVTPEPDIEELYPVAIKEYIGKQ